MAEIIEISDYIKSEFKDLFQSGEAAQPGHYVDINNNSIITLFVDDELPSELKIMRFGRQYRRFEDAKDAQNFIRQNVTKQRAA